MANDNAARRDARGFRWTSVLPFLGFAAAGLFYFSSPRRPVEPTLGHRAPDLSFEVPGEGPTTLWAQRGKVLLINFWASWCEPCLSEMPSLARLEARLANRKFRLLAFEVEEGERQTLPYGLQMPRHIISKFDGRAIELFRVGGIPHSILMDAEGTIRKVVVGPVDWEEPQRLREIEALLP